MRPFTLIAAAIFALMGLVHLYRLVVGFPVTIGNVAVPSLVSWIALAVSAGLTVGLLRESRR